MSLHARAVELDRGFRRFREEGGLPFRAHGGAAAGSTPDPAEFRLT